ncbi:MAG: ATP-binding protein [Thermoleophilaceae bacterium]|nr:ATP-binding protein [Thermoleophilaceae bacterium]
MALNPFVWDRPLDDPTKIVGMDDFAAETALILKAQTNVAIFGPRDTGKSTFITSLGRALAAEQEDDAPPHVMIRVDLKRALSIPAFISCVDDAIKEHPDPVVAARGRSELEVLERELGFDLKLIKGSVKRGAKQTGDSGEALHGQLRALSRLGDHVVVVFDEFQRLNRCPGDPLAIIGSALMGASAQNTTLLFTGSIREYLEMLLNNSREPIFNQASKKALPTIARSDFREYLAFQFEATGRQISDRGLGYLLELSRGHPKRTQQLAWATWLRGRSGEIGIERVQEAFEELLDDQQADFAVIEETLANGDESDTTDRKALFLIADHGGTNLTSARLAEGYGLGSHTTAKAAMPRLQRRGLVDHAQGDKWQIIDPFLEEWLHRNSPFAE